MSIRVYNNASVKVVLEGSPEVEHDLSDHVESVKVTDAPEQKNNTAMGSRFRTSTFGLRTAAIDCTLFQDYDANSVHAVLQPLVGADTDYRVEVIPEADDPISTTNPQIIMTKAQLSGDYNPVDAKVGEVPMTTVKFSPGHGGTLSYNTTP